MKDRTPVPRSERPPLPEFTPVVRKSQRHDGWTPERQRAFIEALADTGSVSRAAAMVNMSCEGAYFLRRQKGAEGFRRAWEAALDYGVARMKDIAFERAIEGYLVPMFVGGKLIGWRRKYNDRLLMFCLRHYGEDANGKRTTINYFSTKATAAAGAGAPSAATPTRSVAGAARRDAGPDRPAAGEAEPFDVTDSFRDGATSVASAEASTTTVRTVISGKGTAPSLDSTANLIDDFAGVELDERAREEILAVLQDCAARRRAVAGTPDDESELFIAAEQPEKDVLIYDPGYKHPRKGRRRPPPAHDVVAAPEEMIEPAPRLLVQPEDQHRSGPREMPWEMLDQEEEMARIEQAVESVKRAKRVAPPRRGRGAPGSGPSPRGSDPAAGEGAKE